MGWRCGGCKGESAWSEMGGWVVVGDCERDECRFVVACVFSTVARFMKFRHIQLDIAVDA
jgi:hypothetical protein